jgi:hypothetical protein
MPAAIAGVQVTALLPSGAAIRKLIAEELGILGLEHRVLRRRYVRSRGLQARGVVLSELLLKLPVGEMLWARLLAAGTVACLFKAPKLWVPQLGQSLSPFSQILRATRGPP